jgi:hypothetical protein
MSEIIKINKCVEVVDNWGNSEQYKNEDLFKLLITPDDWTDDQIFISDERTYYIDDLIGRVVQVGTYTFKVQE